MFGTVKGTVKKLQIDVSTRKMVHMLQSLHPRSSVPRLYLSMIMEHLHDKIVLCLAFRALRISSFLLRILKSETEDFIIASQGAVFNTLIYCGVVNVLDVQGVRCKTCHQAPETVTHLLSIMLSVLISISTMPLFVCI